MIAFDVNISLNVICLLFSLVTIKVSCHIGEPCNSILKICLPVSTHMYCDHNNICRCKQEYPVAVGPHSCRQPRRIYERCMHPEECIYYDRNSHCTQTPYNSQCECNVGFIYDKNQSLCVIEPKIKKPWNVALTIQTTAGLLMACFTLLCCCIFLWHNICRKNDIPNRNMQSIPSDRNRRSRNRTQNQANIQSCLNRRNATNVSLNESQTSTRLPPYESVLILQDEPPPSYEDAIKDSLMASSSETTAETKT